MHADAVQTERRPRHAMHWLCCALVLVISVSRQLVICTHADGPPHLEFAHPEGSATQHRHGGCCHDHVHVTFAAVTPSGAACDHDSCDDSDDPHSSCDHVHLSVEVGPQPAPDHVDAANVCDAPSWAPPRSVRFCSVFASALRPPPGTGPPSPGPRPYLAHRASTVLLI